MNLELLFIYELRQKFYKIKNIQLLYLEQYAVLALWKDLLQDKGLLLWVQFLVFRILFQNSSVKICYIV